MTLLQDLQGPKIRVGDIPNPGLDLIEGARLTLVPIADVQGQANTVGIDYPDIAEEAEPGTQVLLDDGLLELRVEAIAGQAVHCTVVKGGVLKSHKGVNFPTLNLRLPSMTEKDERDLAFGIEQGVDIVSLSFVRQADDVRYLKSKIAQLGADQMVLAKLEKPQAIDNLEEIVDECNAIMVARGDLGVEMRPERVPLIQKQIIEVCNRKGVPVITATQMLDSMIHHPRPTRAEASDVANAMIDGTDAVMLSGESAVGAYPVESVAMLARIAIEVEPSIKFTNYPPRNRDKAHALVEALNAIDQSINLQCIVAFTESGFSAKLAAAERPTVPIIAMTPHERVYHRLNLVWGVRPVLFQYPEECVLEELLQQMEQYLLEQQFVAPGDNVLILAGVPLRQAHSTNFMKIHTIGDMAKLKATI